MKKLCLLLVLSFMSCSFAMAKDNYGFIDLPYILNKYTVSANVNSVIKQRENEIQKLLKDANTKMASAKDETTKKTIEANAKKQIQPKLDSLATYRKQQNAKIETAINTAISKVAKANNYALILSGNSVVYGATNISDLVVRELNQR